jgi:hypothetical protein
MRTRLMASVLLAILVVLGSTGFAATEYVIVNNNSTKENAATLYQLDTTTGTLTLVKVLRTGGTGLSAIYPPDVEQAITPGASCVFVMDTGTSDIASFSKSTQYTKVGNYSNFSLGSDDGGGSIDVTPNGKFLYGTYSATGNVGAWLINADCSLTYIASYLPSVGLVQDSAIKVTPNNEYVVVGGAGEQFSIDQNTGELTAVGTLCPDPCLLNGIDFTKDSKVAVFANGPNAYVASVTRTGLKHSQIFPLAPPQQASQIAIPFFGAAGYSGSGSLYFGATGGGTQGFPSAVVTANFTENPLNITVTNITPIASPKWQDGSIAVSGNIMVIAELPDQIGVYQINSDGSLTQLSTTTVEGTDLGVFSLSLFPDTR